MPLYDDDNQPVKTRNRKPSPIMLVLMALIVGIGVVFGTYYIFGAYAAFILVVYSMIVLVLLAMLFNSNVHMKGITRGVLLYIVVALIGLYFTGLMIKKFR